MLMRLLNRKGDRENNNDAARNDTQRRDADGRLDLTPPEGNSEAARIVENEREPMRRIMHHLREQAIRVAYEGARLRTTIARANDGASQQNALVQHIEAASSQTQQAVEDAAQRAETMASNNQQTMERTRQTQQQLSQAADGIDSAYRELLDFQQEVESLTNATQDIDRISRTVDGFSKQTNLLALNASVEAARAGEAGQSFSVVAQEIKDLASKVKASNSEIRETVSNIEQMVGRINQGAGAVSTHTEAVREVVRETSDYFGSLVEEAQGHQDELQAVGSALEQLSASNTQIHNQVQEIAGYSGQITRDTEDSESASYALRDAVESMCLEMFQLRVGQGVFEELLGRLCEQRDRIQARMQAMQDQGVDLFDARYREKPADQQADPKKYVTGYVEQIAALQPMVDGAAELIEDAAFGLLVDRNGYAPLNHSRISQEPTGDPAYDLKNSRHHRFFDGNETERRRYQNTQSFLLQLNVRDTGEILADLAVPIYVSNRIWGNLVIGFPPGKIASL